MQEIQKNTCIKFSAEYLASPSHLKVGISLNIKDGIMPVNGLRHQPVGETTGWYIWAGNSFSKDADFFEPLHVAHLIEWCPDVVKYLGLPPGWRFLVDDKGYEDVWFDNSLLR